VTAKLELRPCLVHIFSQPVSRDDSLRELSGRLQLSGYVKESYPQAVIEREKVFPTGLPTQPVGIAIPHTDAEHVYRSALSVGILCEPVAFEEMGNPGSTVEVHIISMLAIADPQAVMTVLRKLAGVFQNRTLLADLKAARDEQTVADLLLRAIPDVVEWIDAPP
jgi:PTS system galactitol-specific IIA component